MSNLPYPPPVPPAPVNPQTVYVQAPSEPAKGLGIAAMVCGIVGSVFGLIPILFILALPLGIVALVLGTIAWRKRARRVTLENPMGEKRYGRGAALTGIILGGLAIVLAVAGIAVVADAANDLNSDMNDITDDLNQPLGIEDAGDVDHDGFDDCLMFSSTNDDYETCIAAGSSLSDARVLGYSDYYNPGR